MTNYYFTCATCRVSLSKSAAIISDSRVFCSACNSRVVLQAPTSGVRYLEDYPEEISMDDDFECSHGHFRCYKHR